MHVHHPPVLKPEGVRRIGHWLAENGGWLIVAASIWLAPHLWR